MIRRRSASAYPSSYPCFNREGYGMELSLGLIRTNSDVLTFSQRRSYTNLPTIINASITIPVAKLYDFTTWLNNNVGLWVDLPLAHPFLTQGRKVELVPARIIDFLFNNAYQAFGTVIGTATIQLSPTVFIDNQDPDEFDWIIAGREPTPSPDWTIAGRAFTPATDWVIAGTAPNPGAP